MTASGSRLPALVLLVVLAAGTVGCFLPYRPGCGEGVDPPGTDPLLTVLLADASPGSAQVGIDRDGQSLFVGNHTSWLLAPSQICRRLTAEEIGAIRTAWEQVPSVSRAEGPEPARPYLFVALYTESGQDVIFRVRSEDLGRSPALDHALELTLRTLLETYGKRFRQELRAAGLETFLEPNATRSQRS